MKIKHLVTRLRRFFGMPHPEFSRRQIAKFWINEADDAVRLSRSIVILTENLGAVNHAYEICRAQLMAVRVMQGQHDGKEGWEVCAYIPQAAINTLRKSTDERRKNFTRVVAEVLVDHAFKGIYRMRDGKISALAFHALDDHNFAPRAVTAFGAAGNFLGTGDQIKKAVVPKETSVQPPTNLLTS